MRGCGRLPAVLALCMAAGYGIAQVRYSVLDLGDLGYGQAVPCGLNDSGQVVGYSWSAANQSQLAFLYSNGAMVCLGTLPGGTFSTACSINSSGQIAGFSGVPYPGIPDGTIHGFLYQNGTMSDLGCFRYEIESSATALNNSGEIVGFAMSSPHFHAASWIGGAIHDLGRLGGTTTSRANAVNASGQIVGYSYSAISSFVNKGHAFLYSGGTMIDLGTLPGDDDSEAHAINSSGQIVGRSDDPSAYSHPFIYSGGSMTDLGTPGGPGWCGALGINDVGEVVGYVYNGSTGLQVGLLWSGGASYNLNDLVDSPPAGYQVYSAVAINNVGQIAAEARDSRDWVHAVLLTPETQVSGTVSLADFGGDVTKVPVTIEIRNPGTTTVVQTQTAALSADGSYSFWSPLRGTYDLAAKASHWLRRTTHNVVLTGSPLSGLCFTLTNGDVNGDNTVNLADLLAISSAWRSHAGSANWNPNADLNGDGSINLADWLIVSRNWRKSGDP